MHTCTRRAYVQHWYKYKLQLIGHQVERGRDLYIWYMIRVEYHILGVAIVNNPHCIIKTDSSCGVLLEPKPHSPTPFAAYEYSVCIAGDMYNNTMKYQLCVNYAMTRVYSSSMKPFSQVCMNRKESSLDGWSPLFASFISVFSLDSNSLRRSVILLSR